MEKFFKKNLFIIVILILWYTLFSMEIWSAYILPSPQRIMRTFYRMILSGELFSNIGASFQRIIRGYSISFTLAFILGILAKIRPKWTIYYENILEFFRNVPPLSLIPLLILWFGIGETSKIIIIVLASFFPMYFNIRKGILSCDTKLIEVGISMKFSTWRIFRKIILPWATTDILVGMRLGFGYSWRAIVGAEMIAAASGLGYLILDAQVMSRSDKVLVGIITIGILGCFCDKIFKYIIQKFIYGGVENI